MATLFNTKISATYQGLFKTIDNAAITASLKELTDGSGNQSGLYVNTAGDFKVSNILEWGSLKDTGTGVTITRYVTSTDGIENFNNNTSLPTSAAVKLYVDSKFATSDTLQEVLSFGNTTGGKDIVVSAGDDITFTDTSKILMGASSDLQIYHDGANSKLVDGGSGGLFIQTDLFRVLNAAGGENIIRGTENASVELFYNNSKKLETKNTGVDVTGNLVVSGTITGAGGSFLPLAGGTMTGNTSHGDNVKSIYGTGGDLEIYHSGSTSYISDVGTGDLKVLFSNDFIIEGTNGETSAKFTENAAVDLYYDNSKKFETNTDGVAITGALSTTSNVTVGANATFVDNGKAIFGAGSDLQIYHDGSNSYISDTGTGSLLLKTSALLVRNPADNSLLDGFSGGSINLYYDGTKRLETVSAGAKVTGNLEVTGTITGSGGSFLPLAGGTMTGNTIHNDNVKSIYGTSSDLQIYHDGSNSYIQDTSGTGDLIIDTNIFRLRSANGGETMIRAFQDSAVILSHNNLDKLATTSTGISVTGNAALSAGFSIVDDQYGKFGNNDDLIIGHGGSSIIRNLSGDLYIDQAAVTQSIFFRVSNANALDTTALTIARNADASFGRNVTIAGDLTVNGTTTTINTQTLAVEDPLIELSKDNTANSVDIGMYGKYNDGTARYLGLFSDASDSNKFKLFKGLTVQPTSTVNIGGAGYVAADLVLAGLEASLVTSSGDVKADTHFNSSDTTVTLSTTGAGVVVLRPNGKFNSSGQMLVEASGNATFSGDVLLADNKKLQFGAGNDLEIYSDGTDAFVESKVDDLVLRSADDIFIEVNSGANSIIGRGSASVELYYNNVLKFETTSTGFNATGSGRFRGEASPRIKAIGNTATGFPGFMLSNTGQEYEIIVGGNDSQKFKIRNVTNPSDLLNIESNGNATFAGNVSLLDNKNLKIGTGSDLKIFHNATDSFIVNETGNLKIVNGADDKNIIFETDNGSGGTATYLTIDGANEVVSFQKDSKHEDNVKANFGNSADLQIYHDGTNSEIKNTTNGLLIKTDTFRVLNAAGSEQMLRADTDDSVQLYFNNVVKLATTNTGVSVTGGISLSGDISASSGDLALLSSSGEYILYGATNGQTNIYHNGIKKFETTSGGVEIQGSATLSENLNITQTSDVGVLNATNLESGAAVGLSLTYPTSNVAAGDGLAISIGIAGRGRSYIANSNLTTNLDASNLEFYTENGGVINKALTIKENKNSVFEGNIGIGASPDRSLDVRGNGMSIFGTGDNTELMLRGQVEGTGTVRNIGAWHWSVRGDVGGDNDDLKLLRFVTGTYSGTSMQISNSTGNIAIGTNITPSNDPLTVSKTASGSTTQILSLVNPVGNANTGVRLWMSGTNTTTRGTFIDAVAESTSNNHSLRFGTSAAASTPTERMRIASDGTLTVGNQTNTRIVTTITENDKVDLNVTDGTNTTRNLTFSTGGTQKMRLTASGELRIGTGSGANGKLHIVNTDKSRKTLIEGNGTNQGFAQKATLVNHYPVVSAGTQLIIPFNSQGNLNSSTIIKIWGHSARFNSSDPRGFEATIQLGHLAQLYNVSALSSSGNISGVSASGMNLVISFTVAYTNASLSDGIFATIEYMTNNLSYSLKPNDIVMN